MHPKLFEIPFIHWPVGTYGPMLVLGFLAAIVLIRRLSATIKIDPEHITNAALYSLVGGVIGARLFYVIHYFDRYNKDLLSVFRVWKGGLELLGGVIVAIAVILAYLKYHKLPIRKCLDILAIGLMLALVFGRIGCFLNGCCYGKPTNLPWGVIFPAFVERPGEETKIPSFVFDSQINPNLKRNRTEPHLYLPEDYFYPGNQYGFGFLKEYDDLSDEQRHEITKQGQYHCRAVHPTQIYTSICAGFLSLFLYLFWRRAQKSKGNFLTSPGDTFSLMFIVYGIMRFTIETFRDDNPFEYSWWAIYKGGTVSQNISIYMIITGALLIILFEKINSKSFNESQNNKKSH